jgi:hypothetical protein
MEDKQNNKSSHILTTSSNLLGICFIVLTSLKLLNLDGKTLIDEFTAFAIIMFMISSVLSCLSISSKNGKSERFEKIADVIFLLGLFPLFVITMFITFNIIK